MELMSLGEAAECTLVIAVGVKQQRSSPRQQNGRYPFGFEEYELQRELERRAVGWAEWSDSVCLVRSEAQALVIVYVCLDPGAWRLSGGT